MDYLRYGDVWDTNLTLENRPTLPLRSYSICPTPLTIINEIVCTGALQLARNKAKHIVALK